MRTRTSHPPVQEAQLMNYRYAMMRGATFATILVALALVAINN